MKRRDFVKKSALSLTFSYIAANQWAMGQELPSSTINTDVCVYGATPAGVCAAIGAAREGARVILIEPTAHIGGVNTGGLSFSDSSQVMREAMGGLWREWHQRIEKDYKSKGVELPYKVDNENGIRWTYEPHVAMKVTLEMLSEAKVKVISESPIISLTKNNTNIDEIYCDNKKSYRAKVYIDCTYEGDLMALAGVEWVIGREGKDEFDEDLAGKRYGKPVMNISGYNDKGDLLPLITTDFKDREGAGDDHVMTYSFRRCMERPQAVYCRYETYL
jgi:hypothetical protein